MRELAWRRKQPTFRYATTGFTAKWRLRNERRSSILMTRHYPDLGSASDCLFFFSNQSEALPRADGSSVWNFCVRATQKTVLWPKEMITSSCWIKRKCIQINRERKKNTIQENDSEDRVGRWIWKKIWKINSRPPGFYLMRKREKLASIMIGTKVVCDRLRSSNLSSWLMKAFSTNAFAIVRPS